MIPHVDAAFLARDFSGNPLLLPGIERIARDYSWDVEGGPYDATIDLYGSEAALMRARNQLLRCPIELSVNSGRVWWGMVYQVEITLPTARITTALEPMFNEADIVYTVPGTPAFPTGDRKVTPVAQDLLSVSRFGRKWGRSEVGETTDQHALSKRDRLLTERGRPVETSVPIGSTDLFASVYAIGWWRTLDWLPFELREGLWGYEDVEDYEALWSLAIGQHFYINNTIRFVEASGAMAVEDTTHTLATQPRSHTQLYVNGTESGRYVLASRNEDGGQFLLANPGNVYVHQRLDVGPTVAIHPYGIEAAIGISHDYADPVHLSRVQLMTMKEGANLLDGLQVELRADAGGLPSGTPLATAVVDHSQLIESFAWTAFDFLSTVALLPFTRYWLVVTRSSPNPAIDGVNFYLIQINEKANASDPGALGGQFLVRHTTDANGTTHAWQSYVMPHAPQADPLFVVEGSRETTTQLARIVADAGQFLTGSLIQDPSGVFTVPYREGHRSALEEAQELLEAGTSNGRRVLVEVGPERVARFYEEPAPGSANWSIDADGRIRDAYGVPVPPYRCPIGIWLEPRDLVGASGGAMPLTSQGLFVDRATYVVEDGVYRPEARQLPAPWEA